MNVTVARGFHISWFPRRPDHEPGVIVWREAGTPDDVPASLRSAGRPQKVALLVPRAGEDAAALEPAELTGLFVPAPRALAALLELEGGREALAGDTAFFREIALFVLGLLARGRVIPSLEEGRPRWRPFFASDLDRRALQTLLHAMPPSLQVMATPGPEVAPPRSARAVQREILDEITDATARALLAATAPRRGKLPLGKVDGAPLEPSSGDALLEALAQGDDTALPDTAVVQRLSVALGAWKQAAVVAEGAFRTCFRLEPPVIAQAAAKEAKEKGPERDSWDEADVEKEAKLAKEQALERLGLGAAPQWTLSFLLQARDDPSALVPAAEVWRAGGAAASFLGRDLQNPHERFLADLGRAARLFPPLEPSLHTQLPERALLSTDEAYGFLRDGAGAFEEAGLGVIVPSWWSKEKGARRLAARLKVEGGVTTADGKSFVDSEALLEFSWDVVLGENALDRRELEALAALKVPLVKVRGEWVELRREDLDAAMKLFTTKGPVVSAADAVESALGASEEVLGLPVVGLDDRKLPKGRFFDLLKALRSEPKPSDPSDGFKGRLRPYQALGLAWLETICGHGMGALLADDMGLGKTIQVLAYLEKAREKGELDGPTLLLCPTSVLGNWRREAKRFTPALKVLLHHGIEREKGKSFEKFAKKHDLVLTSYGLALRDQPMLRGITWSALVIDEAQNLKNPETKQTRAVRSFDAARRIALTGTPVENRLADLHSIMEILNPGLLGTQHEFRRRFAIPIERLRDEAARTKLRRLLRPFFLRREKTDPKVAPDLPEKVENKAYCMLTPEQATLYKAVVDASLADVKKRKAGIDRSGAVLGALTRLKQVCNHPAHFLKDASALGGRSGKLERLTELLEEVYATKDKALVFTQFKEMGDLLVRHLKNEMGEEPLFLHGGVPRTRREEMIRLFSQEGGPRVFVLSLKAGGTGLNLTRACHVFHFDRWWNPAVEDQATDRAFRIGQTRAVMVHKLVCQGTLEERLDDMIEAKKSLAKGIVGAGEGWITELSDSQLAEIMTLREDAVQTEENP
ncbi:DEAD/DEAH box helicase [bacterium]|nr:DEAD/DEAH box helicase [bacterium]